MDKECTASASEAVALLKIRLSLTGPSRTDSTKTPTYGRQAKSLESVRSRVLVTADRYTAVRHIVETYPRRLSWKGRRRRVGASSKRLPEPRIERLMDAMLLQHGCQDEQQG